MHKVKSLIGVFTVALAAAAFGAPVFAQAEGWGGDVEDFSAPRPAQMKAEGGADFGAALEAASAAEGRSGGATATASAGGASATAAAVPGTAAAGSAGKTDGAAANTENKKTSKLEGSGERLGHTMGVRLGVGSEIDIGLGFGIGLTDLNRIEVGYSGGWGIVPGDAKNYWSHEGYILYEWRPNISDELSWFFGFGGTVGYKGTSWGAPDSVWIEKDKNDTTITVPRRKAMSDSTDAQFGIGLGGRFGLEVDLSFIDPDHSLKALRSSSVSLDARPMLYLVPTAKKFPVFVMTLGITYKYVFGGGKNKESK